MCIAILISGNCSNESCIVNDTNRQPYRGNCLIWDPMPSVRAAVLIPQISIPFLRTQGAQVWGSGHFAITSLDSVLSSRENEEHYLLGRLLLVFLSWRTIRADYSRFCTHCIFCRQMFLKTLGRKEGNLYFGKYTYIQDDIYNTMLSVWETITKTTMRSLP